MILPEWSHRVRSEHVGSTPMIVNLTASEQQCLDVARRLKVPSVSGLTAKITLQRQGQGNLIYIAGSFEGDIVQSCVISAEPVPSHIKDQFEAWFSEEDDVISLNRARRERLGQIIDAEIPIMDEKDDPEPVLDGEIDVGDLTTQYLSLALNPYPLAEGVERGEAELPRAERPNPFAALKDWKGQKEK